MKIVFMGTPEFAVPSLDRLIKEFEVVAVLTQPDRPKGRGKKLSMSFVKEKALEYNIPVLQPEVLKDDLKTIEYLKNIQPDFIIVVAYGQILSKEILNIPKYACINLHASLLPKYRGAAPINWAIIKGEMESGNTTMLMNEGLDTGDMLLKSKVLITENMTAGDLHDILMEDGANLLVKTVKGLSKNEIKRVKQNDSDSCYASMLHKKMGKIDWKLESKVINNLVRGLNPWPIAYTNYKDKAMKIYEMNVLNERSNLEPGSILEVSKDGIKVVTGDGCVLIKKIQFPSKKPLNVEEYIKGHSIDKDVKLE
ncbi:methionyl-tRNA formyltransferase [Clostridium rectalis]|uniref:methionyl-tRNA formyltransferase n=1 Tax=Clostridium rectalis TaxID=2040295 RepID=UPI000F636D0F|nr:methionyl-tRNA formyltransferase [Clostridium rectalis]